MPLFIPKDYSNLLGNVENTEKAIKAVKDMFQTNLSAQLALLRVTAPMVVLSGTGINDDLNSVERPVRFPIKGMDERREGERYTMESFIIDWFPSSIMLSTVARKSAKEQARLEVLANRLSIDRDIALEMNLRSAERRIMYDELIAGIVGLRNSATTILNRVTETYLTHATQDYEVSIMLVSAGGDHQFPVAEDRGRHTDCGRLPVRLFQPIRLPYRI